MREQPANTIAIQRLTALWAFSESGLGGLMHSMKLPFTGFFVGGFAVIIIGLLAHYSGYNMRRILECTILVILVKAVVSPQSPPPSYIAVAFQGLIGAVFFRYIKLYSLAAVLFGMVAMLESALQKVLMMTLIFGKSVWEALDLFFKDIVKDLSLPKDFSFSFWLIIIYTGIYAIWGMLLGIWSSRLPKQIALRAAEVQEHYYEVMQSSNPADTSKKTPRRWKGKLFNTIAMLLFIVTIFLLGGHGGSGLNKAAYVILRTIAALLLLFRVVNPILKWAIDRWMSKHTSQRKQAIQAVLELLPELRSYVRPAYRMAAAKHKGPAKYKEFIFILIVLTLHLDHAGKA